MCLHMVDRDQRFVPGKAKTLGGADAHQQAADQPRRMGDGNGLQIGAADGGAIQGFGHHGVERLDVRPGGNFRHHAAVFGVQIDLRGNHAGMHPAAVLDDGRRRFIASGFDAENQWPRKKNSEPENQNQEA